MNIKFDSEPICGDKDEYIKTKLTSHGAKMGFCSCQFRRHQTC